MARVKCTVCNHWLHTESNNAVFNAGVWSHLRCPKTKVLTAEEANIYRSLTDAINKAYADYFQKPNWRLITQQIKEYKTLGYSYEEQIYTLNYVITKDGNFWAYGRVGKFLIEARRQKKAEEAFALSLVKKEPEKVKMRQITSKPSYLD